MSIYLNGQVVSGGRQTEIQDSETIVNNESSGLDAVGIKTKDGSVLYDWVGTKAEYEAGIADGSISEDWICWVTDEEGGDKYRSMPIGSVFAVNASKYYVPDGCLPCDGAEYSKSQFVEFWDKYLIGGLLNTCTYSEYAAELTTHEQCSKFAIDIDSLKFKVPTIKDGAVVQQALTDGELGKAYNAGIPNIEGSLYAKFGIRSTAAISSDGCIVTDNASSSWIGGAQQSGYSSSNLGIDASLSSSVYGNSDTVQMNAIALRYFVVVANGTINQSQMDWSEWSSSLQGRANIDLSNVTESGRTEIVSWNIPDYSKQIEITVVSNGLTTFTAPSGGYVWGKQMSSTAAKTITINGVEVFSHFTNSGTISNPFYYIVGEGDVVVVDNYTITDNNYLYFAPMKGTN